jgi:hypothetical protein
MGAKAMIHTIAGKARGFPIKSIGTMMDEPFTGLVYLKESGITKFEDIKGRKIGYVGEFGKVQVCPVLRRIEGRNSLLTPSPTRLLRPRVTVAG